MAQADELSGTNAVLELERDSARDISQHLLQGKAPTAGHD